MQPLPAIGLVCLLIAGLAEPLFGQVSPHPHPYGGGESTYRYQRDYGRPHYEGYGAAGPGHSVMLGAGYPVYGPGIYSSGIGLGGGYWFGAGPSNFWYGPMGPVAFSGIGYGANSYTYIGGPVLNPVYVPTTVAPGPAGVPAAQNPLLADAWWENQLRWQQPLPEADPRPDPTQRPVMPSTAEGRRRSLQAQIQGDDRLRRQEWGLAAERYRRAVETAEDQASNHIRLGVALAAQRRYDQASREFRRAVFVDRNIARTAPRLSELLGHDRELIRIQLISWTTTWAQEDIRDPERLWVLGVLLHLSDDPRAAEILAAGYRLAGGGDHFLAFVNAGPAAGPAGIPPSPQPAGIGPKVIEIKPPPELPPPPEPGKVPAVQLPPAPAPAGNSPDGKPAIPQPPGVDDLPPLPRLTP